VAVSNVGWTVKALRGVKSTHTRMPPSFFGALTMGWTHAVGLVTLQMICCSSSESSSVLSFGSNGTETGREPLIADGMAPSAN
jgi:hypothetical protein